MFAYLNLVFDLVVVVVFQEQILLCAFVVFRNILLLFAFVVVFEDNLVGPSMAPTYSPVLEYVNSPK